MTERAIVQHTRRVRYPVRRPSGRTCSLQDKHSTHMGRETTGLYHYDSGFPAGSYVAARDASGPGTPGEGSPSHTMLRPRGSLRCISRVSLSFSQFKHY